MTTRNVSRHHQLSHGTQNYTPLNSHCSVSQRQYEILNLCPKLVALLMLTETLHTFNTCVLSVHPLFGLSNTLFPVSGLHRNSAFSSLFQSALLCCFFFFCHAVHMQDLSSPTRDRTWIPLHGMHVVLTTGPPGMSLPWYSHVANNQPDLLIHY